MLRYEITPAAEREIESILLWTYEQFGAKARQRYEALLIRAIEDVAKDPARTGSCLRPEIAADLRTYHLWQSRSRVKTAVARVKHPRHFLLYRVRVDGVVEIGRVLHDSMDIERQLSEE